MKLARTKFAVIHGAGLARCRRVRPPLTAVIMHQYDPNAFRSARRVPFAERTLR